VRLTRAILAAAAIWSCGLLVAALVAPVYSSTSTSSSGVAAGSSATLVQVNGMRALILVGLPLLFVGVVAFSLWRRRKQMRPGPGAAAWAATGLLGAFTFVSMLTIGLFVLPVTVLLTVTCARSQGSEGARAFRVGAPDPYEQNDRR
jgi:hypothetical protein